MNRTTVLFALGLVISLSQAVQGDTLHGFCVSPTPSCTDNGTITPTSTNPPNFGFSSSGATKGIFELVLLSPNDQALPSLTINGVNLTATSVTSSLVSPTAFTSGTLESFLLLNYTPSNPLDAFLPSTKTVDPGATGYYVFTFNFGFETGNPKTIASAPTLSIASGVVDPGSIFLGLELNSLGQVFGATPSGGAIFESGAPTVATPEPKSLALMGLGIGALLLARKRIRARLAN